jgi:voltage-gated potassium channel Kch
MSYGWLSSDWLIVIAIALSISFIIAAPFNTCSHDLYAKFRKYFLKYEREELLPYEQPILPGHVRVIIFGMGRIGTGAYDEVEQKYESTLLGVDFDAQKVESHKAQGRNVVRGSVTDPDFWERLKIDHESVALIMLAVHSFKENLYAVEHLRADGYDGKLTAIAQYPDEEEALLAAGADSVFNLYKEAGAGFAEDCSHTLEPQFD